MGADDKTKVLVIGSGPAGLGAAIHLLEQGQGQVEVTLIHQGHHLGGRAASYRDEEGHVVEHGIHMMFGFYTRLRALMKKAGIDEEKIFARVKGMGHIYADWSKNVHELDTSHLDDAIPYVGFDGVRDGDKLAFARYMVSAYLESRSDDLVKHDDVCLRTWSIEEGLDPELTNYSLFRTLRQPYFNYPYSVSAYHVLKAFKLMGSPDDAALLYVRGGFSELVWDPIGAYLEKLGGVIEPYTMALDWVYTGRRITGVKVARPDGGGHDDGKSSWKGTRLPHNPETVKVLDGFDYVVSAVPHAVFVRMNEADEAMWSSPYFKRLKNIRSIATLSMTVSTKKPLLQGTDGKPIEGILGLPPPMGNVAEMKMLWDEVRDDPEVGSYLYFSGTEKGYEDWTDQQIIDHTIDFVSGVPGVGDIRAAGIQRIELHRNKADFERLVLSEPGVNQFRPGNETPFENLFVAGDWVRNDVDLVVSMEGALLTGQNAANLILAKLPAARTAAAGTPSPTGASTP